ncbi:hypothetical protein B296_00025087 [Ensete ventricosum]|uniref:Uncharacterized protein n=1 Tax=Ensete ventricosum TaxID=4639 RepID=A0A427ATV0_ENSVE|nr:hypothetical protein B296_00025087 [Ensete ventricosum]
MAGTGLVGLVATEDDVVGRSKIGRVLGVWEKKNDKGKGNAVKKFMKEYGSKRFGKIKDYGKVQRQIFTSKRQQLGRKRSAVYTNNFSTKPKGNPLLKSAKVVVKTYGDWTEKSQQQDQNR